MTNSKKRNGLAWGRYLKESVAVVPHEDADLMLPMYQAFNEPVIIEVDTFSGYATLIDKNDNSSRCKVTHETKNGDLIPVLVDNDSGLRFELDRFKVTLRCRTSQYLVPKRLEKISRVPNHLDFDYQEVELDNLTGANGYVKVGQKLQKLILLKEDVLSELHEQALTKERQTYLAYMLDMIKTDIKRCEEKEKYLKVTLLSDLEYSQKFMDSALHMLDPSVIQKIQDNIE